MSDVPELAALSDCLVLNTIKTARALTRRYDNRLKAHGITVCQFTVLGLVRRHGDRPINALAELISMDRTTLSRNLDILIRRGLVEKRDAEKGNSKICQLTPSGDALLDVLLPQWLAAQQELTALFESHDPQRYLETLRALARG